MFNGQRSWNCPQCNEELGELNGYCVYCKVEDRGLVFNPDKYYIRDIRISHITKGDKTVTPQEELFSQLFNHEKILVKDMSILELRAHREELAKIAFEARARLTAADDEEKERKKKDSPSGPRGFATSLNVDETSSNAINTIKERQKKLTGKEKMLAGLTALYEKGGMSAAEALKTATAAMGAGKILSQLKPEDKVSKDIITGDSMRSPLSQENGFTLVKPKLDGVSKQGSVEVSQTENKPLFNPFTKKSE